MHNLYKLKKIAYQLIDYYPRYCLICLRKTENRYLICFECVKSLPFIKQACVVCRAKLASNAALLCGQCLSKPYAFDQVVTPFYYAKPITRLLFQLKFYEQLASLSCFTYFLIKQIKRSHDQLPSLLIPVPLHKKRLKKRGYNQSLELAKRLSLALNINLDRHHCQRIKFTQSQQGLNVNERRKNVRNAFRYNKKLIHSHVAVVDDVLTTGATAHEMAKGLKKAGAKTVYIWCCARA